jgi:hypothetical protein
MREALTSFKNVYNMITRLIRVAFLIKKLLTTVIIRIQNDVKNGNSFIILKSKTSQHLRRIFSDFKSVAGYNKIPLKFHLM